MERSVKKFIMKAADLTENVKLTCTLTGTSPDYGIVYVDENMNLIHAPAETDANDTLHLENGILSVETPNNEYHLNGNVLGVVRHRLNGSVTAEAWVYTAAPEMLVEFKYDSNGLRTQKKVTDHGQVVTTDYIYHGKQLAGLTCGNDTLHFFYDARNRPVKVDCNGTLYTYIHNLQGDIVGLINDTGAWIVKYVYDAWGKTLEATGPSEDIVRRLSHFRYRGYIYDEEMRVFCLRSRLYYPERQLFITPDVAVGEMRNICSINLYAYCRNLPIITKDASGEDLIIITASSGAVICGHTSLLIQDKENNWHYYYYGPESGASFLGLLIGETVPACIIYEPVTLTETDPNSDGFFSQFSGKVNWYHKKEKITLQDYDHAIYITGDFTASHAAATIQERQRESQKYNLYSSNCLINSLKMIEASISGFIEQLYKYKNIYDYEVGGEPAQLGKIVPNYMHGVLEKYFTEFVE